LCLTAEFPATQLTIELIPDPEQGGLTTRLPDVPTYGDGDTESEAIADLKEAVRSYIDAFSLDDLSHRFCAADRAECRVGLRILLDSCERAARSRWNS
jgi:hypothetical protein